MRGIVRGAGRVRGKSAAAAKAGARTAQNTAKRTRAGGSARGRGGPSPRVAVESAPRAPAASGRSPNQNIPVRGQHGPSVPPQLRGAKTPPPVTYGPPVPRGMPVRGRQIPPPLPFHKQPMGPALKRAGMMAGAGAATVGGVGYMRSRQKPSSGSQSLYR